MPDTERSGPRGGAIVRQLSTRRFIGGIFANHAGKPYLVTSLDHLHKKLRSDLRLPNDCVIHSFRHTFLTRFGEAGADAFRIKKVADHSSMTISKRYIHPTPEGQERALERFANQTQEAVEKAEKSWESLQSPLQSQVDRP
jgi:integrase